MVSGYTGPGAKTVIPSAAMAKISTRLVPDQDHNEIRDQLEADRLEGGDLLAAIRDARENRPDAPVDAGAVMFDAVDKQVQDARQPGAKAS